MSDEEEPLGSLAIHIGVHQAGELVLKTNDVSEFRLLESYRELPMRPVLGQVFEDDLTKLHRSRMRLPPFFSNLLPEGRLRELVADRLGVSSEREFFLLARLGEDLPGAIRATPVGRFSPSVADGEITPAPIGETPLKFSLAGVQLKFSMLREGRGMTIPASGQGGDWIVKLPGKLYKGVPENEYATMNWARLVGIEVPGNELVAVADLTGIPQEVAGEGEFAFAVRRFDRPSPGLRTHVEDFAQVRNQYPDPRSKYRSTNYETIGKTILRIAGEGPFEEFVRRLAFTVVSANADAHIKNWSFIYPDAVRAQLSPAYDLVSTIEFIERDELALNLAKTKDWERISLELFAQFAERIGADPVRVTSLVRDTVQQATDLWPRVRREFPVSALLDERLARHWKRVPLLSTTAPR